MSLLTLGAGLGSFGAGGGGSNSFYMPEVIDLWPQLATSEGGTWSWLGDSSAIFGGFTYGSSGSGVYREWTGYLSAGSYKISTIGATFSNRGILSVVVDGNTEDSTSLDYYAASSVYNVKKTSNAFTVTSGVHTIRLICNTKNASSSDYYILLQAVQLVKQSGSDAITTASNLPHVIDIPLFKTDIPASRVGSWAFLAATAQSFGGVYYQSGSPAVNDEISYEVWAPKGSGNVNVFVTTATIMGIITVYLDGVSLGTIDCYSGSTAYNVVKTLSATVTTTGMHTLRFLVTSKNASASAYYFEPQHAQIIMSSIDSDAISSDGLAPEVANLWPAFMSSNSGGATADPRSTQMYYHDYYSGGGNTDYFQWDGIVLRPGTYRADILHRKTTFSGKSHAVYDGTDYGSIDGYSPGTYSQIGSVSGIVVADTSPHSFKLSTPDKNASASNYYQFITLVRLVRTGA